MKTFLLACAFALPFQPVSFFHPALSVVYHAEPDYTGRRAMLVDGTRVGVLERQSDGTYLLRYSAKEAVKVSINEVVLMPKEA